MNVWLLLFCCSLTSCNSILDTPMPGFEAEGEWWIFETQMDKQQREQDFKELVDNLRLVLKAHSISEEDSRFIEWRSLMLSREYLHRSTDVQLIIDKIQRFEQFLSSGINMISIMENYDDDIVFKSFLAIMMKTRELMLEIEKYQLKYQAEEARQNILSEECAQILDTLNSSDRYKHTKGFQQLVREVLLWKANFEERHDTLIEAIRAYSEASGTWFYQALLTGYYTSEDQQEMGQFLAEDGEADEVLEAARELIRTYQELYTSRENETLEIQEHSEL